MSDFTYRLGKLPHKPDTRDLLMATYLRPKALPAKLPTAMGHGHQVKRPWGMLGNDQVGDCTCASAAHLIQSWEAGEKRLSRKVVA